MVLSKPIKYLYHNFVLNYVADYIIKYLILMFNLRIYSFLLCTILLYYIVYCMCIIIMLLSLFKRVALNDLRFY